MKMKTDYIALALAGVAVYFVVTANKKTANKTTSGTGNALAEMTKEVLDSAGQAFANGWRYFTDGTSIDPYGNYYKGGQLIWTKPASSFKTGGELPTTTNDGVWI
jgi:hypothetical protein